MASVLGLLATLALIAGSMAVMVGALSPGEALRRVGVVLLLLLIVPVFIESFVHTVIVPMLTSAVTVLESAAYILVTAAAIALIAWFGFRQVQRWIGRRNAGVGEE